MTDTTVDFEEVTDGCVNGDGVFDKMMQSVKAHLAEEYDAQRIRGSEYSQVYLGALTNAMGQSIQWQLQAEIAKNQALLIEKQIEGQEKQNLLLDEQRALLVAQTNLTIQQKDNLELEAVNIPKQGLILDGQLEQVNANTDLVVQQKATEIHNTDIAAYQLTDLLPTQKGKTEAEINILEQKQVTEEAQTKDTTIQGAVTGIVKTQKDLYIAQKDGFQRDAEQKASRIVTDAWGIAVSSEIDGEAIPTEINKTKIDEVLRQVRDGAGILGDVT